MADEFYVNKSYLSREFSNKMGVTLTEYIYTIKLWHVKKAIIDGDCIQIVWRKYGFSTYGNFAATFKKFVNMTPLEYKNANGKSE